MTAADNERRIQTTCLVILTAVVAAVALRWLQPVLVPFVLAGFAAIAIMPVVDFQMRRLHLPKPLAVVFAFVLVILILAVLAVLIAGAVGQLVENSTQYQERAQLLLENLTDALPLESLGLEPEAIQRPMQNISSKTVGKLLLETTDGLLSILSNGVLVLIFAGFLLFGGAVGLKSRSEFRRQVEGQIRGYIVTKVIVSLVTGVLVGGVLYLLGVELALGFGLMAFVLNFIPSVGSIISTLLPLPVLLLTPGISVTTVVLAMALPGAIQFGIGNVVEPRIMGKNADLHPVTILMSLIVWGMLWGIIGMFLSTPLTAILKILLARIPITAPFAALMAGRTTTANPEAGREDASAPTSLRGDLGIKQ